MQIRCYGARSMARTSLLADIGRLLGVGRRVGLARRLPVLALAVVLGGLPAVARAQTELRFDQMTGRNTLSYPPDRHFDHRHLRLELDIPDMRVPEANARVTITVAARGVERRTLRLQASPRVQVDSIRVDGRLAAFAYANPNLSIAMDPPAQPGEVREVVIEYRLDAAGLRRALGGITWDAGEPNDLDPNNRPGQIHTQGQPDFTRIWLPSHDHPNEKMTTEVIVTVPEGYQVLSNGRLLSKDDMAGDPVEGDGNEGRRRWHWLQDQPHPIYLVTLVVGQFDIVTLAEEPVPMRIWAPLGRGRQCLEVFKDTPRMMAYFVDQFGEYPWAKYDQVTPRHYTMGAMENTSASTFYIQAASSTARAERDIIAHELIHQWFGNLVTCESWEHLWLNEGWASMGEALWAEEEARQAGEDPEAAYLGKIARFLTTQRMNQTSAPLFPGLASKQFNQPFENFFKTDNPYGKGALVLHMLRRQLGDRAFFEGSRLFLRRHAFGSADTDDFRRALEEVSGVSLQRFFEQWVMRPGIPSLEVDLDWDSGASAVVVRVRQLQTIDRHNPAYAFDLPLAIVHGGERRMVRMAVDGRVSELRVAIPSRPSRVEVDPGLEIAARTRVVGALAR